MSGPSWRKEDRQDTGTRQQAQSRKTGRIHGPAVGERECSPVTASCPWITARLGAVEGGCGQHRNGCLTSALPLTRATTQHTPTPSRPCHCHAFPKDPPPCLPTKRHWSPPVMQAGHSAKARLRMQARLACKQRAVSVMRLQVLRLSWRGFASTGCDCKQQLP